MNRPLHSLLRFGVCLAVSATAVAAEVPPAASPAEKEANTPLPNVLIIGDSISLGYTPPLAAMLKGEAVVKHHKGNAQFTGTGLKLLDQWIGETKWDVIHFNWGLWDLCYRHPDSKTQGKRDKLKGTVTTTLEQYEQNLDQLVTRLNGTGATLIWASTTVVPEGEAGRFVGDDKHYNNVAATVMKKHGIPTDDLNALTRGFSLDLFQESGNVHYTKAGYQRIAAQVAGEIRKAIKDREVHGKLELTNFHASLVPKGFVLSEKDWHIWCNAPILDEQGTLHLFVSRWPIKDTFGLGWHTSCEIAHYKADQPEGSFTYVSTVLKGSGIDGSWRKDGTHNVTVVRLPDHRYAMLFIANSNGTVGFPSNQKIGMMLASSLDGPWKFVGQDGLVLDVPNDAAVWSHGSVVGVNNPTLLPMSDGHFLLYYKAMKSGKGEVRRMGVAIASKVEGPYRFEKEALTANEGTIEDGFAFLLNGEVCLLVTDCHGEGYGGGMIYHSEDGISFEPNSIRAYEAVDHYLKRWPNPAKGWSPWVLQRPALLLDHAGTPTHLFAPCGTPPEGRQGTATFLLEIRSGK